MDMDIVMDLDNQGTDRDQAIFPSAGNAVGDERGGYCGNDGGADRRRHADGIPFSAEGYGGGCIFLSAHRVSAGYHHRSVR